ncbi:MAG: Trk system potassium transporter TrkA [Phycisphaerales bacterium]
MNIVICGAGEIGSHAAEILSTGSASITVIDTDAERLRRIEDDMDVATVLGNAAQADVLSMAGVAGADLLLAATDQDEVNLLCAAVGRQLGARRSVARVHRGAFFQHKKLDYTAGLGIDKLICPEFATAAAIARTLRNPGAMAIENFGRGRIEMQEFLAGGGSAIGQRLVDVRMPPGARLALIRRREEAFVPAAHSVVVEGDSIILVGNQEVFADACKRFRNEKLPRRRVVIMGGPPMAVWLCRSLRDRRFSIRLFETDRVRAEELAEKLDWVTVINADPTDRGVFDEENLANADIFISLLDSDEANIIAGVLAKTRGVDRVVTVVQKLKYLDVVFDIGVDHAFCTRQAAGEELEALLDARDVRPLGSLAQGNVDVLQVRVQADSPVVGRALRDLPLSPDWVVAAISRDGEAFVPGADDVFAKNDEVMVAGRHGKESAARLEAIFAVEIPE